MLVVRDVDGQEALGRAEARPDGAVGGDWDKYDGVWSFEKRDDGTYMRMQLECSIDVPLIGLRGISDGPEPPTGLHTWTNLLGHLDEELARAVDLIKGLAIVRAPHS